MSAWFERLPAVPRPPVGKVASTTPTRIRAPRPGDAAALAELHLEIWAETHAGVLPASAWGEEARTGRIRMWGSICTAPRLGDRCAVAERDGRLVGLAGAGASQDTPPRGPGNCGSSACWLRHTAPGRASGCPMRRSGRSRRACGRSRRTRAPRPYAPATDSVPTAPGDPVGTRARRRDPHGPPSVPGLHALPGATGHRQQSGPPDEPGGRLRRGCGGISRRAGRPRTGRWPVPRRPASGR
ncbi:hypothetical protein J2T21_001975 [Paeniglutamicibacter psychrophenolicus]|nr:hypothetical protein [Paeniglutamicibacter psychrophenolicus]